MLPGSDVRLSCEGAGAAPAQCVWRSPSGCCYGDCDPRDGDEDCRGDRDWSLETEGDTCVLALGDVSRSDTGDTWTCDQVGTLYSQK